MPVTEQQIAAWEASANIGIDGGFISPEVIAHHHWSLAATFCEAIPLLIADLLEAKADCERHVRDKAKLRMWLKDRDDQFAAIQAKLAEAEKDAKRYRLIRDAMFDEGLMGLIALHDEELERPEDFDRVVSAAIAAQEKP